MSDHCLSDHCRLVWIRRHEQRVVPWRNGGGSTREVAVEPAGGSLDAGFAWRVSIADIASDGPFSQFPGVDRCLWLLHGAGMDLDFDGERVRLDQPLQRVDFAGEDTVAARLLNGATSDLNVMVSRARVAATAAVHAVDEGCVHALKLTAGQHLLLSLTGTAILFGGVLGPGDALLVHGTGRGELLAADGPCRFLSASFVPRDTAADPRA